MKKIGVFSGTFDPFHIAHLEACLVAKAALDLDSVVVMIEKHPTRKVDVTNYQHRLAMVDLAIQQYPSIRLLDTKEDNITTENTLPLLKNQFNGAEYWFIMGSDMLEHIESWPSVKELFEEFHLCVVLKSNQERDGVERQLNKIKKTHKQLAYKILPEVWSPISSTNIRQEVADKGYSEYVHRDVLKYILTNQIY